MYIKSIDIKNIRSIKNFHWELQKPDEELAGWHVLIGDNGSGKSTVLKAVSLALLGDYHAQALRQDWNEWLQYDKSSGLIELKLSHNPQIDMIEVPGSNEDVLSRLINPKLNFERADQEVVLGEGHNYPGVIRQVRSVGHGWFSVAFGPYRRFKGTEFPKENSRITAKILAHLSVFDESIALTDSIKWLQELRFRELEKDTKDLILLRILNFINQEGFLPHEIRIKAITSQGVFFGDINGAHVSVEQLGDGYRSILSMVFDIIRQMQIAYQTDNLFNEDDTKIIMPGVVLIDEIDAHLHPEWQRTIGYWLIKLFPEIQFIVTTHSPLICQAAYHGSIWRLPSPGSEEEAQQISPDSKEWKLLVYGDILEAYSTDLFGENIDRSPEAQKLFEELGELSVKEMEEPLSPEEEKKQSELREKLPNVPSTELIISTLAAQGRGEDSDD